MELLLFLPAMRVPLSLRPPDRYDSFQLFLHGAGSHEFGIFVCGSIYSGADFSNFATFILLELSLTAIDLSRKPVPPPPPLLRPDALVPLS